MNAIILFIISIPLIEIYLMIKVGGVIGAFNTIFLIFFTAITGIYFARLAGLSAIRSGFNQLIKNEILSEFDLIHIHPGYLPEFRGADNSLHMILNNNSLGVSSFFVNKGIDTGKIITRKKWLFKSFDFELQDSFTLKEKYMFWYSFVDPLLRAIEFKEIINLKHYEKSTLNDIQLENEVSNYYSFMTDDDLKLVFKKIF